jgi:hypothetical protein
VTQVAALWRGPTHNFAGAWEFVVAVLVIIVVIFFRVYGPRSWSWRPTGHRGRRTATTTVHRVPDHDEGRPMGRTRVKSKRRAKGSGHH